ncbi:GntR family transcriptional regulator [Rhizobium sp. R72]|uniref:FadR/GntR family transcriptional regulator n=1 Tax=unclassified Rhizobium TaxID=2613769 RepID=UPI000B529E18|nr:MULTISPECIES: FadR/GntR family transcriptional regulator [unclassified Rhizobium]OWW05440.1 GntR family transcriptional regulator [Rhizobium sp. R72]OWW06497.1 GntR family transcriptional regulator [Rhizobium sp. R711]
MTTHLNTAPPPANLNSSRRQKLSERIAGSLRQDFLSGQFSVGHKLPTESQLALSFGVSRTVIREAIAALVADGMLETRQGAGIFVIGLQRHQPLDGPILRQDRSSNISHALNVLEVRIALETESAALAAARRNPSQEAQIQENFFEFDRLLQLGKPTGQADFAFHRSIAEATNNPFYVEVLDALGERTIPCDVNSPHATEEVLSFAYQAGLQREHLAILNAISAGDAACARDAMRAHLSASQERYRERLRDRRTRYQSGVETT